tara:strand:- start:845 stop:1198 length:354 start_codon:yes stop_codon:yes gene_type:complete
MRVFRNTTIKLGPGDVAPSEKKIPAARIASHAIGSIPGRDGSKTSTLLTRGLHPSAMEVNERKRRGEALNRITGRKKTWWRVGSPTFVLPFLSKHVRNRDALFFVLQHEDMPFEGFP